MPKFYTSAGDGGETHLYGRTARKSERIFDAIGSVDELNSAIGLAIANLSDERCSEVLRGVQNNLFVIGAELSGYTKGTGKRTISDRDVKDMENAIDDYGVRVGSMERFVLPGGCVGGAHLQHARSVARRAERSVVALEKGQTTGAMLRYLNRVSSLLFVMALYVNKKEGYEEANPEY